MKLVASLFLLHLLGCAMAAAPQARSAMQSVTSPSVRSLTNGGGVTPDTGSGSGGHTIPTPHPNV